MNKDLPAHPNIFTFMNQLRCSIYQQGISIVALHHSGGKTPSKGTVAARKLAERAHDVEEQYLQGLLTPTEVLLQAASHFKDNFIQDAMDDDSNRVVRDTYSSEDNDNMPQSQDPALQDPLQEDERRNALDADEGLTDMGNDDWELATWTDSGNMIFLISNISSILQT
jgi:uncharacterized protein YwqG